MNGFMRKVAPVLPLLLTVWCAYDAVMALQQGRTGKAVWEGAKALLFVGVAYLMNDTGSASPTSDIAHPRKSGEVRVGMMRHAAWSMPTVCHDCQHCLLPDRPARAFGSLADARMVLQQRFGYPDFRPPQRRAVEAVLSGRDALIVLPTGGGKSLCYQVPALVRGGLTVVVSPLISLMKDQVEALERRGIAAAYINSTLSASATADRMARARSGDLAMLYLSPERLESGRMSDQLHAVGLALLAVDEAHCISEWGHDFRPSYRRIGALRALLGAPQTVALTATATPDVRRDIERQLVLRDAEIVVGGFDRTNLTYHVRSHPTESAKDHAAVALLRAERAPSIVYTPTRKAVERVTGLLVRAGIKATAYHAGLAHTLRQRAQDAFMEERTRVIVATSAFGMGIDKPDVRLVVHHAMPGSLEAYYQEAGRAGRDGKASTCILLYDPADRATHDYFIAGTHPERHAVERTWAALRAAADGDGLVHASVEQVARAVPGVSERVARRHCAYSPRTTRATWSRHHPVAFGCACSRRPRALRRNWLASATSSGKFCGPSGGQRADVWPTAPPSISTVSRRASAEAWVLSLFWGVLQRNSSSCGHDVAVACDCRRQHARPQVRQSIGRNSRNGEKQM